MPKCQPAILATMLSDRIGQLKWTPEREFPAGSETGGGGFAKSAGSLGFDVATPAMFYGEFRAVFVSNDDYMRSVLQAYLEHLGFKVQDWSDLKRATERFLPIRSVALLIVDVDTLGAEGIRVAAEFSANCPRVQAIVISSSQSQANMFSDGSDRGWRFLKKPIPLPAFLALIHATVREAAQEFEARLQDARMVQVPALAMDDRDEAQKA